MEWNKENTVPSRWSNGSLSKDGQFSMKTTLNIWSLEIISQGNHRESEVYGMQKSSWHTGPAMVKSQARHTRLLQMRVRYSLLSEITQITSNLISQIVFRLKEKNNALELNWSGGRYQRWYVTQGHWANYASKRRGLQLFAWKLFEWEVKTICFK